MMQQYRVEAVKKTNQNIVKLYVYNNSSRISNREVFETLEKDSQFVDLFTENINNLSYEAIYMELPRLDQKSFDEGFEAVLINAPSLARRTQDKVAFSEHYSVSKSVVNFSNKGGDAELVIPCPISEKKCYTHLMEFIRLAPPLQVQELFKSAAKIIIQRISKGDTIWFSSAGLGVSWLHLRLDSSPKYFKYEDYRNI